MSTSRAEDRSVGSCPGLAYYPSSVSAAADASMFQRQRLNAMTTLDSSTSAKDDGESKATTVTAHEKAVPADSQSSRRNFEIDPDIMFHPNRPDDNP